MSIKLNRFTKIISMVILVSLLVGCSAVNLDMVLTDPDELMIKAIAESHKGSASFENTQQGSLLRIVLPAV